jgi:hypothetical protein
MIVPARALEKNRYVVDMFYRSPNQSLVYAKTLKCASTYYSNNFKENGWQACDFDHVDWENDYVFGFLIDPYQRHVKGMIQDMLRLGIEKILMQSAGQTFWYAAPTMGVHSMAITEVYKGVYHRINWIPLDLKEIEVNRVLEDLFARFDTRVHWKNVFGNQSDDYKKDLFEQIYKSFLGPGQHWYDIVHGEDVELYNNTISLYKETESCSK